jgi:hypothetical protein
LVDAVTADSGDRFRVVGEVIGQPHGRLLRHDITISRCQAATQRPLVATDHRLSVTRVLPGDHGVVSENDLPRIGAPATRALAARGEALRS